jgi:hypothetical protein
VFGSKPKQAWLIDFDLADTSSSSYPPGYTWPLPERIALAQPAPPALRETFHDLFALGTVMSYYKPRGVEKAVKKAWKKLTAALMRVDSAKTGLRWPASVSPFFWVCVILFLS